MDVVGELFCYIFENLEKRFAKELEAIKEQYPFEPFKIKKPIVKLTFQEGVELLKENGIIINPLEDLDTPSEKKLGEIVKKKFETDFFIHILRVQDLSTRCLLVRTQDIQIRSTCS